MSNIEMREMMSVLFGRVSKKDLPINSREKKTSILKTFAEVVKRNILGGDLIRCTMIGYTDDQETLKKVAAGRVKGSSDIERAIAIEKIGMMGDIESQRFLGNLATTDPKSTIRGFATEEVKNQSTLAEIIENEKNPAVLKAAIRNVERLDVLEEVMLKNRDDASVFEAVRQRLVDLSVSVPSMMEKMGKLPKRVGFGA